MDCHALRCKARNDRENNAYTSTARNDGKIATNQKADSRSEAQILSLRENPQGFSWQSTISALAK
ncbi:hypothetical protein [Helicobacter zhangjianzhongii]|uniref:Uncharacterized protein n=1 Tax=Helicobacter zhangjianzhongii TaxID=2974574 RepID=A0ACC6FUS0_9HELI|nr:MULTISPECIES: hypothetical protein [unclassified Helicobacter]MDL0081055.1 hypothetical protein [Helicobacter sp. CPD2-1]MDL0083044.1 hypothetical protein [Helicobacter sp. XJK30-2]